MPLEGLPRASGVLAKNDPLDARMIASFVAIMPTRPAQRQTPMIEQRRRSVTTQARSALPLKADMLEVTSTRPLSADFVAKVAKQTL
jgi:hypothetical protein